MSELIVVMRCFAMLYDVMRCYLMLLDVFVAICQTVFEHRMIIA